MGRPPHHHEQAAHHARGIPRGAWASRSAEVTADWYSKAQLDATKDETSLPPVGDLRKRIAREFDRLEEVMASGLLEERRQLVACYVHRITAEALIRRWCSSAARPRADSLAAALRSACALERLWRERQTLEVVWTRACRDEQALEVARAVRCHRSDGTLTHICIGVAAGESLTSTEPPFR